MTLVAIDTVLANVRQLCRKAPNLTLRRAYTRAMREWCQQTQWLRMTLPGPTAAGQKVYNFGTDDNLDIMGLRAMSLTQTLPGPSAQVQTWGLVPSDSSQWNPNLIPDLPRRYCYIAEGRFALDPTPDAIYTVTASLIVAPKESADATAMIPSDPLVKYSNDIESGALAYLFSLKGEPWFDPGAAQMHGKMFQAAINNGKAEVQRAFNTGSQRVRAVPFGTVGVRRY